MEAVYSVNGLGLHSRYGWSQYYDENYGSTIGGLGQVYPPTMFAALDRQTGQQRAPIWYTYSPYFRQEADEVVEFNESLRGLGALGQYSAYEGPGAGLPGMQYPTNVYGLGALGALEASEADKRSWLSQIESMEARKKKGLNPQVIHQEASTLFSQIQPYGSWRSEWFAWKQNIPDRVNYNQRLGALMIMAAGALTKEQAASQIAKSTAGGSLVTQAQRNKAIVAAAEQTAILARKKAAEIPVVSTLSKEASVYGTAAKKAYEDVSSGDPFRAAREQNWFPFNLGLPMWQLGLIALAVGVGGYAFVGGLGKGLGSR